MDDVPWDVALLPFRHADNSHYFPAVVLRPRPLCVLNIDSLDAAFLDWMNSPPKRTRRGDTPIHPSWIEGTSASTWPPWPTISELVSNTQRAVRHVEQTIDESRAQASAHFCGQARWAYVLSTAALRLAASELRCGDDLTLSEFHATRLTAERFRGWPKGKDSGTMSVNNASWRNYAAVSQLGARHPALGTAIRNFVSGERTGETPQEHLSVKGDMERVRLRLEHPFMSAVILPLSAEILHSHRDGAAGALMEWLFDRRGRQLFRWLFGLYGRRLHFAATHLKNSKTGADIGNGLAMLKLSAFAYLSPLDTDQGLGGSDYLRWSLAFDGHRHLNEPSVRGNKP